MSACGGLTKVNKNLFIKKVAAKFIIKKELQFLLALANLLAQIPRR